MIDNAALEAALSALDSLYGLSEPKARLKNIVAVKRVFEMRAKAGLPSFGFPHKNMVFTGNPGTGKSIFARHLGEVYRALGILSKGHVVECDRSQLVGGYVGQTAVKTREMIDKAMGGILFIDSAENLYRGNSNDFGIEALDVIHKVISNPECDLVVIFADYEEAMSDFLNLNPAIAVKMSTHIHFEDLTSDILYGIFMKQAEKKRCAITDEAAEAVKEHFETVVASKDKWFGNARVATMFFDSVVSAFVMRIAARASVAGVANLPIELCDVIKAK